MLYVQAYSGNSEIPEEVLWELVNEHGLPRWHLHGICPLGWCDEDPDVYDSCIYSETKLPGFTPIDACTCLTEKQKQKVLAYAAQKALSIVLHRCNYREFAAHLLDRYPEARNQPSVDAAIIQAALAERSRVFEEDDYEDD